MKAFALFFLSVPILPCTSLSATFFANDPVPQAPEILLEAPLRAALNLFQTLTKKAATIHCGINYAQHLGVFEQPANSLPSTPYSRLAHLFRAITAFQEYKKVTLPQPVIDAMRIQLLEEEASISEILIRLNEIVPKGFTHLEEIRFLLEESPNLSPKGPFTISLPDALRRLHEPLFALWRQNIVYAPASDTGFNIFARLHQLKELADGHPLTVEEEVALGAPIGTLEDATGGKAVGSTPQTLFGKAGLVQRIISRVLAGAPAHFPRIHHLLTHPDCSIGAALSAAVDLIQGRRTAPLRHTVADRLDELHATWKRDLAERILPPPQHWPAPCVLTALSDRLQMLNRKLIKASPYVEEGQDLLSSLQAMFTVIEDGWAPLSGLAAPLATLARILALPSFAVDDRGAQMWGATIGNAHDAAPRTLFGIVNTVAEELWPETITRSTLEAVQGLIGMPTDTPTVPGDPNRVPTFWSLINHLALESLKAVYPRETLWERIDDLEDHQTKGQLIERLRLMDAALQQILKNKTCLGLDRLIHTLAVEGPRLLEALQEKALADTQNDAWWDPASPLYGPLNRILGAAVCGKISTIVGEAHTTSSCRCPCCQSGGVAFQDIGWTLRTVQDNLRQSLMASAGTAAESKVRTLVEKVGTPQPLLSGTLETISDRWTFLQKAVPSLAPFLDDPQNLQQALIGNRGIKILVEELQKVTTAFSPDHLIHAQALLREITARLNQITHQLLTVLFGLAVDPYRAQYDGFTLQPKAAIRCDLQTLRYTLGLDETIARGETFRRLGGPWEDAAELTVFGRLASVEKALLQRQKTALPIERVLQKTAQFVRQTRAIASEGWTDQTAAQIGTGDETAQMPSLFGTLNGLLGDILASPVMQILEAAQERLDSLAQKLQEHPGLQEPTRKELLNRIENLPLQLPLFSNALNALSGFLRPRTTEQCEVVAKKLLHNIQELTREIDCQPFAPDEEARLKRQLGTQNDVGTSSLWGLANTLALRIHALFLPLKEVCTSEGFAQERTHFETYRQTLRPGSCEFYYMTDALKAIQTAAIRSTNALQSILTQSQTPTERALPPEAAQAFDQTINQYLGTLTTTARFLAKTVDATAQALPSFLGRKTVRHDLSDVVTDLADGATKAAETTESLIRYLGYTLLTTVPTAPSLAWEHANLSSTFHEMITDIEKLSKTIECFANARNHWGALVSDPSKWGLQITFQSLEFKSALPQLETIAILLRKQAEKKGSLLCRGCEITMWNQDAGALVTVVEQLSCALKTLGKTFEEEARTGLLHRSEKALERAFELPDGRPLAEIEATWPARVQALETQIKRVKCFFGAD